MKSNKCDKKYRLLFLLLWPCTLMAAPAKPRYLTISGSAVNAVSIDIITYPDFYIIERRNSVNYSGKVENGKFHFHLPAYATPVYISIVINQPKGRPVVLDNYLVAQGDSIYITQDSTGISFEGSGAKSFTCQYNVRQVKPKPGVIEPDKIRDYFKFIDSTVTVIDSLGKKKMAILDSARQYLNPAVYAMLKTDYEAYPIAVRYTSAHFYMGLRIPDSCKEQIIRYYKDKLLSLSYIPLNENSKEYLDLQLAKIRADGYFAFIHFKPADRTVKPPFSYTYQYITNHYAGLLRERLLALLFVQQRNLDDTINVLLTSARQLVKHPVLQNMLTEVQRQTKGSIAYPFNLPDSSGKRVQLRSFAGKVVVLDFWYTGCTACRHMAAEVLHPVAAEADTNVVFISICIDPTKEGWKRSIASGLYTHEGEINLFTEGLRAEHPLIKYYKLLGYPTIIIVDKKGKISSINPSDTVSPSSAVVKLKQAIVLASKESE